MMIFKITMSQRKQGLSINLTEFWNTCFEKGINLPQSKSVAASSFCEARQEVTENIFIDLNKSLLENWSEQRKPSPMVRASSLRCRWIKG